MVSIDTVVQCPECEHEFALKDVTVWQVCLTCGEIWPPGEDWRAHHLDDSVDCDGVHAVRKYSEQAALEEQQQVQNDA
jgi:DNA-directed RNA polymerase subunit RPC12/RpoP